MFRKAILLALAVLLIFLASGIRAEETGQQVNETGNATLNETNATEELIQGFVRKTNLTREIVVEFINYYGAEELEKILNRSRSSGRQLTHT